MVASKQSGGAQRGAKTIIGVWHAGRGIGIARGALRGALIVAPAASNRRMAGLSAAARRTGERVSWCVSTFVRLAGGYPQQLCGGDTHESALRRRNALRRCTRASSAANARAHRQRRQRRGDYPACGVAAWRWRWRTCDIATLAT